MAGTDGSDTSSTVYLDDLNPVNPESTDPKSQGDDHIRFIKRTLKNTFPNIDGIVSATQTELNYNDITTLGTQQASKVLTADANNTLTVPSGGEINFASGSQLQIGGVAVTSSATELNTLDGVNATLTAAELNILDGITATTAEINVLDGITATVDELNILDGVTVTAAQLNTPTLMTAKASTSGTVIDFTEIPTWVKRVTVMLIGVSTNGTSHPVVQIGAGSVVASGYASYDTVSGTSSETSYSSTVGFGVGGSVSANLVTAIMTLVKFSGTTWIASHCGGMFGSPNAFGACGGGWITLSGALDRVRVTTTNGTDAFDAGTINIMYE